MLYYYTFAANKSYWVNFSRLLCNKILICNNKDMPRVNLKAREYKINLEYFMKHKRGGGIPEAVLLLCSCVRQVRIA